MNQDTDNYIPKKVDCEKKMKVKKKKKCKLIMLVIPFSSLLDKTMKKLSTTLLNRK